MALSFEEEARVNTLLPDDRFLRYLDSPGKSEVEKNFQIRMGRRMGCIYEHLLRKDDEPYEEVEVQFTFSNSVPVQKRRAGPATYTCKLAKGCKQSYIFFGIPKIGERRVYEFKEGDVYTIKTADPYVPGLERDPSYVPKLILKFYPSGLDGVAEALADSAGSGPGQGEDAAAGGSGSDSETTQAQDGQDLEPTVGAYFVPEVGVFEGRSPIASPLSANDPAFSESVRKALRNTNSEMATEDVVLILRSLKTYEDIQWSTAPADYPNAGEVYGFSLNACRQFRDDTLWEQGHP